jgi:hypothetical protein
MNPVNIKNNPFSILLPTITDGNEIDDVTKESQNYQQRMNTGVTIRPNAGPGRNYYEIYVQMNVIGGEVNDNNKSKIDCVYQGETLSNKLSRILHSAIYHPWNINSTRIFFDIEQGTAVSDPAKQTPEEKAAAAEDKSILSYGESYGSQMNNYFGGKQSTKNVRRKFIQRFTKRNYS